MKILDILEAIESNYIMYHRSHKSRIESIMQNGLKINSEPTLTESGIWATKIYGCNPIYLSYKRNSYNFPDSVLMRINVEGLPLVADLPGLIDAGAYLDEEGFGIYWLNGAKPLQQEELIDFDELVDPESWACSAAIELSKTAACLQNISTDRITIL